MRAKLVYYRKLNELRQIDLADKVGVKEQMISTYETGRATPSRKIAVKIAKALRVNVKEIFPELKGKELMQNRT